MGTVVHRAVLVLLAREHEDGSERMPLPEADVVVLGRSLEADMTLPEEASLSRCHIRFERSRAGWTMLDLGSTNGTLLNGVLAAGLVPLIPGDEIGCGRLRLRFELVEQERLAEDEPGPDLDLLRVTDVRVILSDGSGPALPALAGQADALEATGPKPEDGKFVSLNPTLPDLQRRRRKAALPATPAPDEPAVAAAVRAVPELPLREALAAVPLFRRLSPDLMVTMADAMTERRYARGVDIVRQGDDGNTLFVMLSGQARVHRQGAGGEDVELALLGPGGFFGEMSLLDGQPRSATVRAMTEVRCALLPRWALESLIRANPLMAMQMLAVLSIRLRAVERLLTV